MSKELLDRIKSTLPEFLTENLYADNTFEANGKIIDAYIPITDPYREEKIRDLHNILELITLKDVRLEKVMEEVQGRLQLNENDARAVALIILREVFYPVKNFFPGIDDEIMRLGGEVPKEGPKTINEQFLKREKEIEDMEKLKQVQEEERMADTIVHGKIEELMKEFPEAGEMVIGSQKSILVKDMVVEMKPMIKYWIHDYKEKMGYYSHSNLERVQYVCHDKNTRSMNEEERRQLNLVLKSSDGEIELPYSTKRKKIDFSQVKE